MSVYNLNINGKSRVVDVSPETPLLWVLRDEIGLVGTKFGCGIGSCGACTVHLDGQATRSCLLQVSQLEGAKITTIEGLSADGDHPVQKAWEDNDVAQCGYCQSGQIMTAAALLKNNPNPTKSDIRNSMHINLCRCATYNRIEKAVSDASKKNNS